MKEKLKKIRKSRIFSLVQILIFIAVCIVAGAFIAYVQHESDPTEQAVVYFRAFVQKNYDKMYERVDKEDGYYLSKDMYVDKIKELRESITIDSYVIKDPKEEDGKHLVTIVCTNADTGESKDLNIYLNEKREGIQLAPDYYVNIDSFMVNNFSVVMKAENHLELNGDTITEDMAVINTDEKGNVTYSFKGIISGEYKVCAVNNYGALVKNINLSEKDTKVELTGTDYTANEKYEKLLSDGGSKFMELFYNAVRKRTPDGKKLKAQLGNNEKLISKVEELVKESMEIVYWPETKNIDNYTVKDMKIKNLKSSIKYIQDKKQYVIKYTYNYDYTSATDTALYTSYVYSLSGNCKSEMVLTYKLKDDKIVLSDVKVTNKNEKDNATE